MTDDKQPERGPDIDAMFASAAQSPPRPNPAFMARLHSDMVVHLPQPDSKNYAAPPRRRFLERLPAVFAASGLTGAAALGVWIGFVMPETLTALAGQDFETDSYGIGAFLPSADLWALEE